MTSTRRMSRTLMPRASLRRSCRDGRDSAWEDLGGSVLEGACLWRNSGIAMGVKGECCLLLGGEGTLCSRYVAT